MLTVDVKVDTKEVMRSLRGLGVDMPKASARALTDGARKMNSAIKKPLQQQMGLKNQSKVKDALSYKRATPNNLISSLNAKSYGAINLRNFKGFRVTKKKGVYANAGGKMRHIPDGFDTDKYGRKVLTFKRTGPNARPIEKLTGPPVPKAMFKRVMIKYAQDQGMETFNQRLSHYVRQALKRRKLL